MRQYEVMVIVDPDSGDDALKDVGERIGRVLTERGGEVVSTDEWGRRKLAYEISKKSEGLYLLVTFKAGSEAVGELDRVLSLADEVMRHKVILRAA